MATENPTWGAPRIHGELMMLGFDISERTVLRWMLKGPRKPEPAMHWAAFLANHREAIAAMDFFTMPMLTFEVLYCFFVIAHDRRRILHCDVTRHPSSEWVDHQLCEAFPYDSAPKYLILDRDSIFSVNVLNTVRCLGIKPVRTAFRSPWQNGIAERWVGNCRRDLLDHVIVLNKRHLKPLMNEYVCYYHDDRTHLGLDKETLQAARQEKVRKPAVELSLCPGSVACIIATIWRPKSLFRRIWIKAGNERLEMCTWPPVSGILGRSFQQICLLDFSVQTPLLRTNLTRHPTRPFLRSDLILARDRRTWCDDACS
jgi:transposase InsO family protein